MFFAARVPSHHHGLPATPAPEPRHHCSRPVTGNVRPVGRRLAPARPGASGPSPHAGSAQAIPRAEQPRKQPAEHSGAAIPGNGHERPHARSAQRRTHFTARCASISTIQLGRAPRSFPSQESGPQHRPPRPDHPTSRPEESPHEATSPLAGTSPGGGRHARRPQHRTSRRST